MQDRKSGRKTRQSIIAKRNIRLKVAFDGTAYCGWQIQNDSLTIQGQVSAALSKITGEPVSLTGSGRTDSGTHARGLIANFFTGSQLAPAQLVRALNSILPRDIRILGARRVSADFHARGSAISKEYRYQMYVGAILPPHMLREYFHFPFPIDVPSMKIAAGLFVGKHDFASFAKTNSAVTNTIRQIFCCELKKRGRCLHLTVVGNGFLHHMVRNMAGTLLEVGRGSISLDDFQKLFEKRDRRMAGFTAPAKGLILVKVQY
jgi:tRNA pseudouridine38-40 synthase